MKKPSESVKRIHIRFSMDPDVTGEGEPTRLKDS